MDEIKIYTEEIEPIQNALETMTDDWIENAEYCDQTIIDLRDACKKLLEQLQEPRSHETIVNCTPSEKAIDIADMNHSFDDKILMVLSSHITHGSSEGALVSAKEFDQILQDMKYLFKRCS